ncbi:MAG: hypothetical protein ABJF04_17335 [Reichenbachiella sp.]|uniref:ComEC/Rec2 family competence protein n=1 Tax=Reichenbachiella sp. TaxID=2184521 RepID=UPI003267C52F
MANWIVLVVVSVGVFAEKSLAQDIDEYKSGLPPWSKGYMDIHHIHTGGGDATFFIFPDGTTMLFDAGDMDQKAFDKKWGPLKATPLYPTDSLTAGQWIIHYINQMMLEPREATIDYALISHFHSDHYGYVKDDAKKSENGNYRLTGITEIAEHIPIHTLIDRNAPTYDYPLDLKTYYTKHQDSTFLNYLDFVDHRLKNNQTVEGLKAGANDQIQLKFSPDQYPSFVVRNVKANGTIWTGQRTNTFQYLHQDSLMSDQGKFNENPLSLALKISYGAFDYFTGGDMTGLKGYGLPAWFDVETPVAKVVGQVEATTLNHHGNRDATNQDFVKLLDPEVVVQQSWCSDHPGQEVFHRLAAKRPDGKTRDIYATNIHEETKVALGPWFTKAYKSMKGHVLIRVSPGGQKYSVYTLDNKKSSIRVVNKFGPYISSMRRE